MLLYRLYCDGACKSNGATYARAAIGGVLYRLTDEKDLSLDEENEENVVQRYSQFLHPTLQRPAQHITNNVAEYESLLYGLRVLISLSLPPEAKIEIRTDSRLVVGQVSQGWKITKAHLRTLQRQALNLLKQIPNPVQFTWIPREQNKIADALANEAILNRQQSR